MADSETGTRTNVPLGGEYQVFLNFRGCDIRRRFADTLYYFLVGAEINIFMDDAEIRPGEIIGEELIQAIDNSQIYIPIFSPNYASSHWCLIELAKMMENISKSKEDENKKVILPIFYDVKPEVLKLDGKAPSYRDAILKLQKKVIQKKKFSTEDVERWRKALREVDASKGLKLTDYSGDGGLSKAVVDAVVHLLQIRQRIVPEDVVGMEGPIATINNYLDIDSNDARLIGICGMSGIGKTTLAKIIYNKLCPLFNNCCSFLDGIRENGKKEKGLVELQKQLLNGISKRRMARPVNNSEEGMKEIEGTISNKKVLIVLDDVSEGDHIQKLIGRRLHPGSRILVTTTEKSILSTLKISGLTHKMYELNQLGYIDALQLFSRHAFGVNRPPANYQDLSVELIFSTGGLPLALQTIGASFCHQENKKIWEERIEELRNRPFKNVLGSLRVTYDALEPAQQHIFLDIACFFIDEEKTGPMFMWKDSNLLPHYAIDVLTQRCMIKILDGNRFWMHEQFRALGRAIAKEGCTRLWDKNDLLDKLKSTKPNESVQALSFELSREDPIKTVTAKEIEQFPNLQFLKLNGVISQGDFAGCLSKLKGLYLWANVGADGHQPLMPTNLHLENVVVLHSRFYKWTDGAVKSLIKEATRLKVLIIEFCCSMIAFNLDFKDCEAPEKLHEQIGEVTNLQHLSIRNCENLRELSDSISKLKALMELDLSSLGITRFPGTMSKLSQLQTLDLYDCEKIQELPELPRSLTTLRLRNCESLRELSDSISKLKSLTELDLSSSGITRLPGTMSKLSQLHTLDLEECNEIQELPELPKSLTTLRLKSTSLQRVPNLSNLTNLVELVLSDFYAWREESNMIELCSLPWIGRLSKLKKLDLCLSHVFATSIEWGSLALLEELRLNGLELQTLRQLPSKLRVIELMSTGVDEVELDGLPNLEELTFLICNPITRISIKSSLNKLRYVVVRSCDHLVEVQFLGVLKLMESLHIEYCKSLDRLVCLSEEELRNNELQASELTDDWRRVSLVSSFLRMLQNLKLLDCTKLQEIRFVSTLEALKEIFVSGCTSLEKLRGLSNLKNLKGLVIQLCENLRIVEGIDQLERLEKLNISECKSMERIIDGSISKIPKECLVNIRFCGQLLHTHDYITWEHYREMILDAQKQALDSAIETTFSGTGDPPLEQREPDAAHIEDQLSRPRRSARIQARRNREAISTS